jgi:5-methylcytosine-specific restriction endonuclease McrA
VLLVDSEIEEYNNDMVDDLIPFSSCVACHNLTRVSANWLDKALVDKKAKPSRCPVCSSRNSSKKRQDKLKRAASLNLSHSKEEWQDILKKYHDKCLACGSGDAIVKDHIVPLDKGGDDSASNLQPLCSTCNSRKALKTIDFRPDHSSLISSEPLQRIKPNRATRERVVNLIAYLHDKKEEHQQAIQKIDKRLEDAQLKLKSMDP